MVAPVTGRSALGSEPIVEPALPVVDPHFHLWDRSGTDYYAPQFARDLAAGHDVQASVYVECGMGYSNDPRPAFRPVGETTYVLDQIAQVGSDADRIANGILGAADLTLGDAIRPVLEAHVAAGKGRFRGVRSRLAWDHEPSINYGVEHGYYAADMIDDAGLARGVRCLQDLGLVLDVWIFHTQLARFAAFASQFPDLPIVVNHCGGPLGIGRFAHRRADVFSDWQAGISTLTALPNVNVKLSGLGISRIGWHFGETGVAGHSDELVAAWQPYISALLAAFGPARCIFASNYPVDRAVAHYPTLLNAFKRMLGSLTVSEREAVMAGNARRVYRI